MVKTNVVSGRVIRIRSRLDSSSNTVVRCPSSRLPPTNRLSNMAFILPCLWWVTSPSPCQSLSRPHIIPPSPFADRRNVLRTMTEEPLLVGLMGRVGRAISVMTLSTTMTTTTTLLDFTAHASSDEEETLRTMPRSSPMIHHHHHPFPYSPEWTGTQFSVRSLDEALTDPTFILTVEQHPTITPPTASTLTTSTLTTSTTTVWPMARWPDPILRRPADEVDVQSLLESSSSSSSSSAALRLMDACDMLVRTAQYHGAVGLAAQQCGINARLIYIQHNPPSSSSSKKGEDDDDLGMVLINPRIVGRSPETEMKVWTEQCLVLPPTWTATVLRDSWIDVEYYTLEGTATAAGGVGGSGSIQPPPLASPFVASPQRGGGITMLRRQRRRLYGETSRCFQHEYDHDRGILLTDHVGWEEMESNVMRELEEEEDCRGGHEQRQAMAYARHFDDPLSE